jgi:hypothetical protein
MRYSIIAFVVLMTIATFATGTITYQNIPVTTAIVEIAVTIWAIAMIYAAVKMESEQI